MTTPLFTEWEEFPASLQKAGGAGLKILVEDPVELSLEGLWFLLNPPATNK